MRGWDEEEGVGKYLEEYRLGEDQFYINSERRSIGGLE
jgi:hypothetical protein